MPEAGMQLWPRPRRRRLARVVDAIARALELMGRYQLDSPLSDYPYALLDEPATADGAPEPGYGDPAPGIRHPLKVVHSKRPLGKDS